MSKDYIVDTRWVITASKAKSFYKCPMLYKLVYLDEVDATEFGEEETAQHFLVGTAFHYIMEKGKDAFLEKYRIAEWYIKDELSDLIYKRYVDELIGSGISEDEIAKQSDDKRKQLKKMLLPQLRIEWYGNSIEWKIPLTEKEGKSILRCYENIMKQPIWDMGSEYIREERFSAKYKTLSKPISLKPDRIKFFDKNGKHYTKDEMDKLLLGKPSDEKLKIVADLGLKWVLRDFKTTRSISKLKDDILMSYNSTATEWYGYVFSMAFYYTVIYALYCVECEVYLDLAELTRPYPTQVLSIPASKLKSKLKEVIIPTLEAMIEAETTGEYKYPSPDDILSDSELRKYFRYFPNSRQSEPEYLDFDTM